MLNFVFKKLQGYPNTDIGLDYNQEPNSRHNYYKVFLNQVYAKKIPIQPPSDLDNLLQDPFSAKDDEDNDLLDESPYMNEVNMLSVIQTKFIK